MLQAQTKYQDAANSRRLPAPRFHVNDLVWFNAENITTRRPSRKLDHRRLGPFKITKVVSPHAYELEFPASMKIHRVQHVSLLDPAAVNPLPGQYNPPPPPVEVDNGEEAYLVEEVLNSRLFQRQLQYLIKWAGYNDPDWQYAELVWELDAVKKFHQRYPEKPGPLPEDDDDD